MGRAVRCILPLHVLMHQILIKSFNF